MPYCDWQLEKANTIWCTPQEAPYNELPLVPIDFSAKLMKQSIYEADYNHEHLQNIVDNLNLLYVAFTRASHNLIVIGKRANSAYRSAIIESVLDKVASRLEANDVKMELTGIGSDAKQMTYLSAIMKYMYLIFQEIKREEGYKRALSLFSTFRN